MEVKIMYQITIKTKFNTIYLEVEDYNTPEVQEIFNQPYIEEIRMEQVKENKDTKYRKLVRND